MSVALTGGEREAAGQIRDRGQIRKVGDRRRLYDGVYRGSQNARSPRLNSNLREMMESRRLSPTFPLEGHLPGRSVSHEPQKRP